MGRLGFRAPLFLFAASVAASCVDAGTVDLTGRECPCSDGWVCGDDGICYQELSAGGADGGPGVDGGPRPDAPGVDGGGGGVDGGGSTSELIWIEAEDGTVEAPMETHNDDAMASGGEYVTVAAGNASTAGPPATGKVTFNVTIAGTGPHHMWGRVAAADTNTDSFWATVDGGTAIQWNNLPGAGAWTWYELRDTDAADAIVDLDLAAGPHTIAIAYREEGARIDKILVTNDSRVHADRHRRLSQNSPESDRLPGPMPSRADARAACRPGRENSIADHPPPKSTRQRLVTNIALASVAKVRAELAFDAASSSVVAATAES